jgi:hypothetical protein
MPDIFEDTIEPLAPPAKSSTTGGRKASKSTRKTMALVEENDEKEEEPKKAGKSESTSRSVSRKVSSRSVKKVESVQEEEEEEEEVPLVTTTTKSTTSKKRSRSRKTNVKPLEEEVELEVHVPVARSNATLSKKSSRSKKSVVTSSSIDEYATALEEEEEEEEKEEKAKPPPRKSTKPSRATKSKQKLAQMEDGEDLGETLGKSTTSKKQSRMNKPAQPVLVTEDDDDDDDDMPHIEIEILQPAKKSSSRSTRGKKAVASKDAEETEGDSEPPVVLSKASTVKSSRSRKAISSTMAITETEEEQPPKKSRSKSRKTQVVRGPSPAPSEARDEDEDEEVEQLVIPKKGRKEKMKKFVKKTNTVGDEDGEVVVVSKGGKGKKAASKTVELIDEETDELAISEGAETNIGHAKSRGTPEDEELEELFIPKRTAKPSMSVENARAATRVLSQQGSGVEAVSEEVQSAAKSQLSAKAKGRMKQVQRNADEDEVKQVSAPRRPPSDVPKNQPKPVVYKSEQSDSDVEMEDATIVRKMLKKKSTSMERLRLPLPPSPPPMPPSQPGELSDGTESEAEVQANLEEVDLDADMDMDIPEETKPLEKESRSLLPVPQEQESLGLHRHRHRNHQTNEDDEDDHAISFAPRLVTKSVEEQRSRTPDLVPIRTSDVPVVLGGSQIALTREELKPIVPAERLTTPPRTNATESTVVPPPETSTAAGAPTNTSRIPEDNSETKPEQPSRVFPEEKLGTEEIESVPQFTPYLSKLPFMALHVLSEVELDMTVEEWIRYQIEVEYDKFKRDGERELARFRKGAEEVRKIIEGL